nr:MAG TPA: hypothetical protein [Caudoviricetes sp.]
MNPLLFQVQSSLNFFDFLFRTSFSIHNVRHISS